MATQVQVRTCKEEQAKYAFSRRSNAGKAAILRHEPRNTNPDECHYRVYQCALEIEIRQNAGRIFNGYQGIYDALLVLINDIRPCQSGCWQNDLEQISI
jgi:hypothetical protein